MSRYRYVCRYCKKGHYATLGTEYNAGKSRKACDPCQRARKARRRAATVAAKLAAGICTVCTQPREPTSKRFCFRHLRMAREQRAAATSRLLGQTRCDQCNGVLTADRDHFHRIAALTQTIQQDRKHDRMRCTACGRVLRKVRR